MTSATPFRRAAAIALVLAAACTAVQAKKPHPDAVPKADQQACPKGTKHVSQTETGRPPSHWCVPNK